MSYCMMPMENGKNFTWIAMVSWKKASGFFVYYEKNTLMSTYLSEYHGKKEQMAKRADLDEMDRFLLHDEKRYDEEIRQDREALARYRSYMNDRRGSGKSQMSKVAVSVALVVMILLSGVLFQNYTKLNEMQKTVASLGGSSDDASSQMIEETISKGAEELAKADGSQEQHRTIAGGVKRPKTRRQVLLPRQITAQRRIVYLQQGYYIVEQGDKLTDISRKVYGTEDMVSQICQKNNIENGDHICAGDKLLLP